MGNLMQATSCTNSQAAHLSAHRRNLIDLLAGAPVITTAEYDTAVQNILACESIPTLQRWYRNCIREIARREELEPVTAPITYATAEQKEAIIRLCNCHEITRAEKTKVLMGLNQLDEQQAEALRAELRATINERAGNTPSPTSTPVSVASDVPAWLVMHGRITRAQRLELERRLQPQQATSYGARCILDTMGQFSAARATAELLRLGVNSVSLEAKRNLGFSVGGTAPAGLLPHTTYAATQLVHRVVTQLCKDYRIAQPGERYDYALFNN
jgi:hypothetical protein